ncbi:MAG: MFS transporter [Anaerolineae bacterium]|nr:MFS transporter [Anaerolineae bacterium]
MKSVQHIQRTYYLLLFLFWLSIALPLSLGILLAQSRGLDLFQVGVLMGTYSFTIVLLEVPTGGLADAIGRKRVALISYICLLIASFVTLFAFSFPIMLLAFILNGVGRALSSGALDAWFIDALQAAEPEIDLQPSLSKAGTFSLLALGLGTLGGSFLPRLFSTLPPDGTAPLTPLSTPFAFAIVVKVLLLVLTTLLVKEERPGDSVTDWKKGFREVPSIIRTGFTLSRDNPTIRLLLGASLASGLAVISLESFWQPYFAGLLAGDEINTLFFGMVMGGNFLIGMVGNLLATPLSKLLNKRYGLVCAIFQAACGISMAFLAMQTAVPLATLLFWLVYLNMGVTGSPHNTLLNQEIPSAQRSAMLSIASLAGYIGSMIGGTGLGYIAEHYSISAAWIIGGLVLVVSLGFYWRVDALQYQKPVSLEPALEEA